VRVWLSSRAAHRTRPVTRTQAAAVESRPTSDIPKILGLYQSGDIKLDEIITRTYRLEEVNEGYDDLLNGKNVRGGIVHEH
jgi:Zn-dependent alcohol dehydrogenase